MSYQHRDPSQGCPKGERLLLWFSAVAVTAALGAWVYWAQISVDGDSPDAQRLAYVAPWTALKLVASRCSDADLFSRFNLPVGSMLVTALWLLGVVGVGNLGTRRLMAANGFRLERFVFSYAVGFTAVGLVTLLLGVVGLARPWAMWGILVVAAATAIMQMVRAGSVDVRRLFGDSPTGLAPDSSLAHGTQRATRIVVTVVHVIVAALLAAGLLYAMTPPIQSDAVRYHLAAPQEYLKAGRIGYLSHNAFSNFPFLMEMHFMLALGTGAAEASQLMHFVTFLVCAASIAAFCRRFVEPLDRALAAMPGSVSGRLGRIVAVCAFLGMPAGFVVASWPFVDHAVCLFLFLSLYALLLAFENGTHGTYVLAGIMLGGAIGTKYTAVPYALVLGIVVLAEWLAFSPPPAAGLRRSVRLSKVAAWALAAAVVCGPWFIKNLALTGNPVYPLASGLFHGGDWTSVSAKLYAAKMAEKGTSVTLAGFFASPLEATYDWTSYEDHYPGATLLLLPIAALGGLTIVLARSGTRGRPLAYLAAASAAYYVLWFVTYQSNRMLVPFAAFLAPLAGALVYLSARCSRWLLAIMSAALLAAGLGGMVWAVQYEYALASPAVAPYLLGGTSREAYLSKALSYWQAFDYVNRETAGKDPNAKVLLVGEHRIYGAEFRAVWSDWFDTPAVLGLIQENGIRDAKGLIDLLRSRGIHWVLYNQNELSQYEDVYYRPRFTEAEWSIVQDFLASKELDRKTIPPGIVILRLKAS